MVVAEVTKSGITTAGRFAARRRYTQGCSGKPPCVLPWRRARSAACAGKHDGHQPYAGLLWLVWSDHMAGVAQARHSPLALAALCPDHGLPTCTMQSRPGVNTGKPCRYGLRGAAGAVSASRLSQMDEVAPKVDSQPC